MHSRFLTRLICLLILALPFATASPQESGDSGPVGTISGFVYDAKTGGPVRQATVQIQGQPETQTVTDIDGQYAIKLPPGTYVVEIAADSYLHAEIGDIVVIANEITDGSTVLANSSDVTTVEVVERIEAETSTAESVIAERKLATAVTDVISNEEISNSTASDAAGALEKVTGVSVVGDGFVYVRGLGERYSATMLNNAMITTTEPEKRVVPLDLFPARLIDNVKVVKTYTADLPGEFSGGLVQMETVQFPDNPILQVSGSIGVNTQTTFSDFQTYPGGDLDFFGFDDGFRSMPDSIPDNERLFRGFFTDSELAAFGRDFQPIWESQPVESARPEQSYSVVAGNTFGKLGVVGAINFSNRLSRYPEIFRTYNVGRPGEIDLNSDFDDFRADTSTGRIGALLNLSYRLSPRHRLAVRNTLTNDADKEGRRIYGYDGSKEVETFSERLRWVERGLLATQIEGEHLVGPWNSMFTWQFGYSRATRDEPDNREILRAVRSDGTSRFFEDPFSGVRFYADLVDKIYEPAGEWSIPFYRGSVTGSFNAGIRATFRERDFTSRRFRYIPAPGTDLDLTLPSDELFQLDNINARGMQFREITRSTDTYEADMTIYGGYFNFDVALSSRWRVIAGMRVEDSDQNVSTLDPLNAGTMPVTSSLVNRNVLPGINVVYSLTSRQNLRFAYGGTVSRPDFRELSPFDFTDIIGGVSTNGNPDLVQSSIQNFDARWEWFFGGDQLIAASFFYKDFTDPIELVLQPGGNQRRTWINAQGATNYGFEAEARRNLAFLAPKLSQFAFAANFTFVESEIQIADDAPTPVTNRERPLIGQSRYLYNVVFEWNRPQWRSSFRTYLSRFSRRISEVGAFGLPDVYEEGRTTLDIVYEYLLREKGDWKLRFPPAT